MKIFPEEGLRYICFSSHFLLVIAIMVMFIVWSRACLLYYILTMYMTSLKQSSILTGHILLHAQTCKPTCKSLINPILLYQKMPPDYWVYIYFESPLGSTEPTTILFNLKPGPG